MPEFTRSPVQLYCRTTVKNRERGSPIVLRVIYRGQRKDVFTGIYCPVQHWDNETDRLFPTCKKSDEINKNLELIVRKANHVFDALRFSGEQFSIGELVQKIKGKGEKPQLLIQFLQQANKNIR